MRIKELLDLIEEFAPLSLQEDYDNAGLICGDPEQEVTSVLLTTDITEAVVDEAIAGRHDLIVSHHPLTLQGLKHLRPETYIQRCLIKAIRQGIGIYSAHTNMDNAPQGVNHKMALKLGLTYDTTPDKMNEAMTLLRTIPQRVPHVSPDDLVAAFTDFFQNHFAK